MFYVTVQTLPVLAQDLTFSCPALFLTPGNWLQKQTCTQFPLRLTLLFAYVILLKVTGLFHGSVLSASSVLPV